MAKKAGRVKTVKADKPPVPRPLKLSGEDTQILMAYLSNAAHSLEVGTTTAAARLIGRAQQLIEDKRG